MVERDFLEKRESARRNRDGSEMEGDKRKRGRWRLTEINLKQSKRDGE